MNTAVNPGRILKVPLTHMSVKQLDWVCGQVVWGFTPGGYNPTTCWNKAGALVDRLKLEFVRMGGGGIMAKTGYDEEQIGAVGPNHMVATVRYVILKQRGDVVDVPEFVDPGWQAKAW